MLQLDLLIGHIVIHQFSVEAIVLDVVDGLKLYHHYERVEQVEAECSVTENHIDCCYVYDL